MKRKLILGLTVWLVMMLLAACGGAETPTPTAPAAEEETPAAQTDEPIDEPVDEPTDETPAEPVNEEPADDGEESTDADAETADLPTLPRLDTAQAQGMGGGGAANEAALSAPAADAATSVVGEPFIFTDVFSGTTFVLNTTLPADVARARVQQNLPLLDLSLADAQALAEAFGFTGSLYVQPAPQFDGPDAEAVSQMPTVYFAFDGARRLSMDPFGVYYSNENVSFDFTQQQPLEQIGPAAEAFLQERGLLDFPYEYARGWGSEVYFYRQVDDRATNQPEISVTFNDAGEIAFVSMQPLSNLSLLGNYPLRSAEEAWALIQDGVMKNDVMYTYAPVFETESFVLEEPIEEYRFWTREYAAGDEAHVYTWPTVYLTADSSGLPRIEVYPFILSGSEADLQAIAEQPFGQLHVWGTVSEDGNFLELAGWERMGDEGMETLYLSGTAQVVDGQALFTSEGGDTYLLPDAPADLPTDQPLNVFAWTARETDADYPVLDWENIDVPFEAVGEPVTIDEPMPVDPVIGGQMEYAQFTVDSVELVYTYTYLWPEFDDARPMYEPPTVVLQPAWKFSGEADNGDLLELFVEAVAPEFLESE